MTEPDGTVLCDTTLSLEGPEYSGKCPGCDFAYDVEATITAEGAPGCDNTYAAAFAFYEAPKFGIADTFLAFDSSAGDMLFGGIGPGDGTVGKWLPLVWYGSPYGSATYSKGVLEWVIALNLAPKTYAWDVSYCGESYYEGSPTYGYYGGAYSSDATIPCAPGAAYDRWTFEAPASERIDILVNTLDFATAFDPDMVVTDGASCLIARCPRRIGAPTRRPPSACARGGRST